MYLDGGFRVSMGLLCPLNHVFYLVEALPNSVALGSKAFQIGAIKAVTKAYANVLGSVIPAAYKAITDGTAARAYVVAIATSLVVFILLPSLVEVLLWKQSCL